jgi:hypothetical protein
MTGVEILISVYMVAVNQDWLACLIIVGHIVIGNLSIGVIALRKQRRWKKASQ